MYVSLEGLGYPPGGRDSCLITGRLAGSKLLLAHAASLAEQIVCSKRSLINPASNLCRWRNLDTLTCYYLLISLEIHPHTLELNQNRFSRIS